MTTNNNNNFITLEGFLDIENQYINIDLQKEQVSLSSLSIPGAVGTFVDPLISPYHCLNIINECDKVGWESISKEYPENYRNNLRLLFKSESLSQLLWKRIIELKILDQFIGVRPFGFGNEGTWEPIGLNDVFKACKYRKGGVFKPHLDGVFVRTDDERSAVTVMIYLNDEFSGGSTNFLQKSENCNLESFANPDAKVENIIIKSINPKTGSCVIFTHDVLHEGAPVIEGEKYILRTEIMFHRVSGPPVVDYQNQLNYKEALRLYEMSDIMEAEGDPYNSTICYLKALDLQEPHKSVSSLSSLSSPSLSSPSLSSLSQDEDFSLSLSVSLSDLPQDVIALIFSYFLPEQILPLERVCKRWKKVTSEDYIWKRIFTHRWPLFYSHPLPEDPTFSSSLYISPKREKEREKSEKRERRKGSLSPDDCHWDFRKCFAAQASTKTPVVVCDTVTTLQAGFAGMKVPTYVEVSTVIDTYHVHNNIVGRSQREMWNRCSAFAKYSAGTIGILKHAYLAFKYTNNNKIYNFENFAKSLVVLYVILGVMNRDVIDLVIYDNDDEMKIEESFQKQSCPFMFVNYLFPNSDLEIIRSIAFEILRVPSFCMSTFGELVLYALKLQTGIVIDFGIPFRNQQEMDAYTEFRTSVDDPIKSSINNPQDVIVDIVKDAKRIGSTHLSSRKEGDIVNSIYQCINTTNDGKRESLENIILVGTCPVEVDKLIPLLESKFPGKKMNVIIPPNSETIIWEGASLFSFSTHNNPFYQIDSYPRGGHEMGKWMSKKMYIQNMKDSYMTAYKKVGFPEGVRRKSLTGEETTQKSKCVVS